MKLFHIFRKPTTSELVMQSLKSKPFWAELIAASICSMIIGIILGTLKAVVALVVAVPVAIATGTVDKFKSFFKKTETVVPAVDDTAQADNTVKTAKA